MFLTLHTSLKRWLDNPSENAGMSNEKGRNPSPKAYGINEASNGL